MPRGRRWRWAVVPAMGVALSSAPAAAPDPGQPIAWANRLTWGAVPLAAAGPVPGEVADHLAAAGGEG